LGPHERGLSGFFIEIKVIIQLQKNAFGGKVRHLESCLLRAFFLKKRAGTHLISNKKNAIGSSDMVHKMHPTAVMGCPWI
jgi:hypothetical protein